MLLAEARKAGRFRWFAIDIKYSHDFSTLTTMRELFIAPVIGSQ
jgi:hypothetical protein